MVKLIQWKSRLLVVVHRDVGWGNVRDRRALLGGAVWQRDGAARWAEGSRRSGEVVVDTVRNGTVLRVSGFNWLGRSAVMVPNGLFVILVRPQNQRDLR